MLLTCTNPTAMIPSIILRCTQPLEKADASDISTTIPKKSGQASVRGRYGASVKKKKKKVVKKKKKK